MTFEFDPVTSGPPSQARPRRRALAVLGASMLVAGAGGIGFGLGRSADGDGNIAPSSPSGSQPSEESSTTVETAASPLPAAERDAEPTSTEPISTAPISAEAIDEMTGESSSDSTAIVTSGGGGWTVFGGEPMELISERITESGVVLRAQLGQLWETHYEDEYFGGPEGWQPPGWCFESGQVRIALGGGEATGTGVIDVGSVGWWSEPYGGRAVSALTMGTADANPYRVVFVQAPASVTSVTVTFSDGASDAVAPANGVAILAVPGTSPADAVDAGWIAPPTDFDVVFDEAGGGYPVTIDGARTGYNDPEFQQSCSPPPPELPEPGDQPADPAGHEASIVELMATIYGDDDGGNDARIDDPTGVADAREQVRNGGFEEAAASAEAIVEELVFTSPDEAWFRYRIETTSGIFSERFGIAVNIDGTWKITRATICQDLSMAGGDCGGDVQMIRPPGR